MNDEDRDQPRNKSGDHSTGRVRSSKSKIGFAVGLVLLVGAAIYLVSDPQTLHDFSVNIRNAPFWASVVVLVGPVLNWALVGLSLHALVRRHGEVGKREMLTLVGSAWLLNHLPMRPGLVGRIGYHKKVNGIRVRDSLEASIWSVVHAAIANAIALGVVLLLPSDMGLLKLVGVLCMPLVVFIMIALVGFIFNPRAGYLVMGLVYRQADLMVWMVRYAAAFAMLGVVITPVQIVLITAASQIAQLIPITGGGIGFREWGVGIAARMTAGGLITMRTAVGADLINRAAETIIVIPLGLICTAMVAKRFASHQTLHRTSHQKLHQSDLDTEIVSVQDDPGLAEDKPPSHAHHKDQSGHAG
jgi:uncharacterized membrane protein YbhN (UPF0104 family)